MATFRFLPSVEAKEHQENLDELATTLKNALNDDVALKIKQHEQQQSDKINEALSLIEANKAKLENYTDYVRGLSLDLEQHQHQMDAKFKKLKLIIIIIAIYATLITLLNHK